MKGNRIKLNESQLRNVIRKTIKKVLREEEEYDDAIPSMEDYGGIDDYPGAPSAEQQWKDYQEVQQYPHSIGHHTYMTDDEWRDKRGQFAVGPNVCATSEHDLTCGREGLFATDNYLNRDERMIATNPKYDYARRNQTYNGWPMSDENNPSVFGDTNLPDDYLEQIKESKLNRIINNSIRKVLK